MSEHYNKNKSRVGSVVDALIFNKHFYFAYNLLFFVLGKITKDMPRVFFTAYFLIFYSYFIHIAAHKLPGFNKIHLVHHTSDSNKGILPELLELVLNLLFIGGGILIPLNLYLNSRLSPFSEYAIILYTFIYTSQHLIVYHYLKTPSHKSHHTCDKSNARDIKNCTKNVQNYGPDALDVLFGTKKHLEKYEDMSPLIPIVIILLILLLLNYKNNFDIINILASKLT